MFKKNANTKISTVIGENGVIKGDFMAEGSVRIDGKVEGNVFVKGLLILGSTSRISGFVSAQSAVIGGEVLGNVKIDEKTELTEKARVLGDITTSVIVIDEKAIFQGKCDMNQNLSENSDGAKTADTVKKTWDFVNGSNPDKNEPDNGGLGSETSEENDKSEAEKRFVKKSAKAALAEALKEVEEATKLEEGKGN